MSEFVSRKIVSLASFGQEYRPDIGPAAARKMMQGYIKTVPGLNGALSNAGWNGRDVTPRIRQVFYDYIGEV